VTAIPVQKTKKNVLILKSMEALEPFLDFFGHGVAPPKPPESMSKGCSPRAGMEKDRTASAATLAKSPSDRSFFAKLTAKMRLKQTPSGGLQGNAVAMPDCTISGG